MTQHGEEYSGGPHYLTYPIIITTKAIVACPDFRMTELEPALSIVLCTAKDSFEKAKSGT